MHLRTISQRAADWPCHANIRAARGYFRATLRRAPDERDGWFWALEWNKYLRVIGAVYHADEPVPLFQNLPPLDRKPLPHGTGFFRKEIPLDEDADDLFSGTVVEAA
jgi:hypothetical protein